MYTVEWQKRDVPHAHILIWLETKVRAEQINDVIQAELSNQEVDPELFDVVKTHMVNGPCGSYNSRFRCMKNGICSERFSNSFTTDTVTDAPSGTSKTFLIKLLLAKIRARKNIVIVVGIGNLTPGSKTTHSMFKIPLDLDSMENPFGSLPKNSLKAKVLNSRVVTEAFLAEVEVEAEADAEVRSFASADAKINGGGGISAKYIALTIFDSPSLIKQCNCSSWMFHSGSIILKLSQIISPVCRP
ncbi:hypothetical protein EVAR_28636_1 [Eumeta japonica]|uniref:ATP-dependent DNA helicase n=1 Tax=Eumeta variegata TaxID=151549 RepID=A0A4C1SCG9_EUMVA|nr:hypothetical protein EVAR_28636_1 [Eumeta japonica]